MLSLTRSGPKILLLESNHIHEFEKYLEERFNTSNTTLKDAFENADENCTIILLVEKIKEVVNAADVKDFFVVAQDTAVILCTILSEHKSHLVTGSRIAPRIILMRVFGDTKKILEEVKKDYHAVEGDFLKLLDSHSEGTIIAFTQQPLSKNSSLSDIYETALFVEEKYSVLHKNLRIHALKYLNEGLNNKDWYELEIKIYDMYEAYTLHYERLLKVIENLELGLILGEAWGTDHPRVLLVIGVYRIRFFTFYDPKYIKKVLLGLEYLADGTRVVDYDVYFRRKKISWTDVKEDKAGSKYELSKKYRDEFFSRLDEKERKEMLALENAILQTRKE